MLKGTVQVTPFREHPIVDITGTEPHAFDITALAHQTPDFLIAGKFSLQQYCHCLLNKLLHLDKSCIKPFLQYQCEQIQDPFTWLNKLEKLIDLNRDIFTTDTMRIKVNKALIIIELLREDIEKNNFPANRKFDFERVKSQLKEYEQPEDQLIYLCEAKTEYLQNKPKAIYPSEIPFDVKIDMEIEKIERVEELKKRNAQRVVTYKNRSLPHKIIIRGHINILVDAFYQMLHEKKANGLPYLDTNATTLVNFIVNNFVDKDGQPLSESTIRTMLSPNKPDKRPKGDNRINL